MCVYVCVCACVCVCSDNYEINGLRIKKIRFTIRLTFRWDITKSKPTLYPISFILKYIRYDYLKLFNLYAATPERITPEMVGG